MDSKLAERILKVKALADKGATKGEKDAAKNLLGKLLKKYNITLEDLASSEIEVYTFKYSSNDECQILINISCKVRNSHDPITYSYHNKKTGYKVQKIGFELTKEQYIEMRELADHLLPLYRKELKKMRDYLMTSFITKHNVVPEPNGEEKAAKRISFAESQLIASMMGRMEQSNYQKKLNKG